MANSRGTAFLSYSRQDSAFALRLAEDLRALHANVWVDQLDIVPGQRWDSAVEQALNTSPVMLVILSPASVSSTNVQDEVALALDENKTIVPILYRDCTIPFRLRRFQHVDFREDYDGGLKRLNRLLPAGESSPTPVEAPRTSNRKAAPRTAATRTPPAPKPVEAPAPPITIPAEKMPGGRLYRQALVLIVCSVIAYEFFGHRAADQKKPDPPATAPGTARIISLTQKEPAPKEVSTGTATTQPSGAPATPAQGAQPLEQHDASFLGKLYVGEHKLRVNRVDDLWTGSVNITRESGILHLTGASRHGGYYLNLSGAVEATGPRQFVLNGEISGVPEPDLNVAPAVSQTRGRFTFNAYPSGNFWRLHAVNGTACVCDYHCGNDFCYIDIGFGH